MRPGGASLTSARLRGRREGGWSLPPCVQIIHDVHGLTCLNLMYLFINKINGYFVSENLICIALLAFSH